MADRRDEHRRRHGRRGRLRNGHQYDGNREVWPFFAIGFCLAAVSDLTLIGLGTIALAMALIYLKLSENGGSGSNAGGNLGDPLDDILNDY